MFNFDKPTAEATELLRRTGSNDKAVQMAAAHEFALAMQEPLRQGIMAGDISSDIFQLIDLEPGAAPEFPLDFLAPGTEKDFVAYTVPNAGRIPERNIEGDFVMVPTFEVANAIDWLMRYARNARWDIVGRALQVLQGGFTKKQNDDCWHTLLAAAVDRNILVYDSDASAGQFTKRLVSLSKIVMRRNGGGNSSSINRRKLTDLYLSPEGIEDMRDWKVDIADEVTRREIFLAPDEGVTRLYSVNLHAIDELGEDQEYQNYLTGQLSAVVASGDYEFGIGLDLTPGLVPFIMPQRQALQIMEDDTMARQRRTGYYGVREYGVAALDSRFILAVSF
jgi:hypothetical protein